MEKRHVQNYVRNVKQSLFDLCLTVCDGVEEAKLMESSFVPEMRNEKLSQGEIFEDLDLFTKTEFIRLELKCTNTFIDENIGTNKKDESSAKASDKDKSESGADAVFNLLKNLEKKTYENVVKKQNEPENPVNFECEESQELFSKISYFIQNPSGILSIITSFVQNMEKSDNLNTQMAKLSEEFTKTFDFWCEKTELSEWSVIITAFREILNNVLLSKSLYDIYTNADPFIKPTIDLLLNKLCILIESPRLSDFETYTPEDIINQFYDTLNLLPYSQDISRDKVNFLYSSFFKNISNRVCLAFFDVLRVIFIFFNDFLKSQSLEFYIDKKETYSDLVQFIKKNSPDNNQYKYMDPMIDILFDKLSDYINLV